MKNNVLGTIATFFPRNLFFVGKLYLQSEGETQRKIFLLQFTPQTTAKAGNELI